LDNLALARQVGLNVPATIVTNDAVRLKQFCTGFEFIIIKDIEFNPLHVIGKNNNLVFQPTVVMSNTELSKFIGNRTDFNGLIFCQKYIEKVFEIRVYFLMDKYYAMAIFSQNNTQTKLDYRNYDLDNPNRLVPFKLPKALEGKIKKMMKILKLESGSIDLIYSRDKKYFFLEVNPIGQFQWLSKHCNYYLEKQIASTLLKPLI
jgi:glutathione synthase/RimK-type ligase-like ATP-grasp enzyme